MCEKRYLINASFTGDARPDPAGACPAYQRLPIPRAPAMQEASAKPANKSNSASLTKPLGSVLGLSFGPSKPNYRAFTLGPATPGPSPEIRQSEARSQNSDAARPILTSDSGF